MIACRADGHNVFGEWRWVRFVAQWNLWQHKSRPLVGYVLLVDAAALVGPLVLFWRIPVATANAFPFIVLMGCGVLYTELSRPIEQVRERFTGSPHIDLNSVWMFAAVLLLHPGLAAIVIATSYFYRWLRVRRHVVHRQAFSAAATILAGLAATGFLRLTADESFTTMRRDVPHFGLVVVAGLIFLVVNTVLITIAVFASSPDTRLRTALGTGGDYSLEAATIALGVLLAWALVAWPIAFVLIVGITLVLHRSVLIRQLRERARTDGKTGLLHSTAWMSAAAGVLDTAKRLRHEVSVLMLDLDHFKHINDLHGHLVGDDVLRHVAGVLRTETRADDLVCRFGGEEFSVLLPRTGSHDAIDIAERIRRRVTEADGALNADHNANHNGHHNGVVRSEKPRVTVSIGVASFPGHAMGIDDLVDLADQALYQAKSGGRNRTVLAPTGQRLIT